MFKSKVHTTYVDAKKPDAKPQEQHQDKSKQKGGDNRPNQLKYLGRTAWRFYTKLFTEAFLGLVLITPLYAYCYFTGTTEVTIPTTLPVLWSIATACFILQGLMFGGK